MGIASQLTKDVAPPKLREPFTEFMPLGDRVAIHEDMPVDRSDGGIIIPDDAQKKPARGTILALGPEVVGYAQEGATQLKVGDRVIYSKYSGAAVRLTGGRMILCIPERDVFGILEEGSEAEGVD